MADFGGILARSWLTFSQLTASLAACCGDSPWQVLELFTLRRINQFINELNKQSINQSINIPRLLNLDMQYKCENRRKLLERQCVKLTLVHDIHMMSSAMSLLRQQMVSHFRKSSTLSRSTNWAQKGLDPLAWVALCVRVWIQRRNGGGRDLKIPLRKIDTRAWYTHELSHESVKAADGKSFSSIVHFEQRHELGAKGAGSLGLSHCLCVCVCVNWAPKWRGTRP